MDTTNSTNTLIASNLTRLYGPNVAAKDVSITLKKGEILGLLGPNGAGKSTTMKMVTGYLAPTAGHVTICGHDMATRPLDAQSAIGYLPEGVPLYLDFSPYLYLDYVCQVRGIKNSKKNIEKVINDLQLQEVKDVRIETLSKGFKRRVGIAQALIHDPKLLILDEPTDGLDPLQKFEVRKLIKNLSKKKAIIISTHILDEVPEVCNKCLIINDGKKVFEGTPNQLKRKVGKSLDEKFRKIVN